MLWLSKGPAVYDRPRLEEETKMTNLLTPVLALVAWTLIVWFWMYATQILAMQKSGLDPPQARFPGSLDILPDSAR